MKKCLNFNCEEEIEENQIASIFSQIPKSKIIVVLAQEPFFQTTSQHHLLSRLGKIKGALWQTRSSKQSAEKPTSLYTTLAATQHKSALITEHSKLHTNFLRFTKYSLPDELLLVTSKSQRKTLSNY